MKGHHPSIQWMSFLAEHVGRRETLAVFIELPQAMQLAETETLGTIDRGLD